MCCNNKKVYLDTDVVLLLWSERICFHFYQYLPMMETYIIGYQVKATPLQVTMVQVVS